MTPESYMRRYHGGRGPEETAPAEELILSCPLSQLSDSGEAGQADDPLPSCCCKASMAEALGLLCGSDAAALVDFDAFFFLTGSLAVGSPLALPTGGADNISSPAASFRRFSPCNCDLIDVEGTAYFPLPGSSPAALEEVDQLSLCGVKAVAFGLTDPDSLDLFPDAVYRRATRLLRRAIQAQGGTTVSCASRGGSFDCEDCCCDSGLLRELVTRNLSRQVTFAAGPLVLRDVTVLGALGSVLVLASQEERRIYLVCASQVEALG